MGKPDLTLVQILRMILLDLLFALLVLVHAAGRWFVRQVLARIAFAILFVVACIFLTDAEKGEPQPELEPDHA